MKREGIQKRKEKSDTGQGGSPRRGEIERDREREREKETERERQRERENVRAINEGGKAGGRERERDRERKRKMSRANMGMPHGREEGKGGKARNHHIHHHGSLTGVHGFVIHFSLFIQNRHVVERIGNSQRLRSLPHAPAIHQLRLFHLRCTSVLIIPPVKQCDNCRRAHVGSSCQGGSLILRHRHKYRHRHGDTETRRHRDTDKSMM